MCLLWVNTIYMFAAANLFSPLRKNIEYSFETILIMLIKICAHIAFVCTPINSIVYYKILEHHLIYACARSATGDSVLRLFHRVFLCCIHTKELSDEPRSLFVIQHPRDDPQHVQKIVMCAPGECDMQLCTFAHRSVSQWLIYEYIRVIHHTHNTFIVDGFSVAG